MAWTQTDLDRIEAMIATGAKESEFVSGDTRRKLVLHSLKDMLRLRDEISNALAAPAPASRRRVAMTDTGC